MIYYYLCKSNKLTIENMSLSKDRAFIERIETVVDYETGEVKEETKVVKKKVSRDRFIMVYLNDLSVLMDLSRGAEHRVLEWMWNASEHGTNRVIIVRAVKDEIASQLGINVQTISNVLRNLKRKQLIIQPPKTRSIYYLNPRFFFKGSEVERNSTMKVLIQYIIEDSQDGEKEAIEVEDEVNF